MYCCGVTANNCVVIPSQTSLAEKSESEHLPPPAEICSLVAECRNWIKLQRSSKNTVGTGLSSPRTFTLVALLEITVPIHHLLWMNSSNSEVPLMGSILSLRKCSCRIGTSIYSAEFLSYFSNSHAWDRFWETQTFLVLVSVNASTSQEGCWLDSVSVIAIHSAELRSCSTLVCS